MNNLKKNKKGFTFLEVLISLALIALLSTIVYVNIDTGGRFKQARNKQRISDVNELMQAIMLYKADNNMQPPPEIIALNKNSNYQIGTGTGCDDPCFHPDIVLENECLDLSILASEGYIPAIPLDPDNSLSSLEKTRYYLNINDYGQIIIGSCSEEMNINDEYPEIKIKK